MGNIKELFGKNRKTMSQKSVSDLTGSATPVESSEYIEKYIEQKARYLPPVNYATASNFAMFGSAEQYAEDSITRIHQTYPYDGSLTEKMAWFNESNFYDIYIFNHRYPRTCGYAVFSPNNNTGNGWGTAGTAVNSMGLSDSLEYIQVKGGPNADPNSGSLKLSRQFPEPWDGKANVWDNTTGINRESNLALNLNNGVTVELWIKKPADAVTGSLTVYETIFDLWNGYTGTTEGDSYGRFHLYATGLSSTLTADLHSGSIGANGAASSLALNSTVNNAIYDGKWHHLALTAKQVQDTDGDYFIEWNEFLDGQFVKTTKAATATAFGNITGSLIANIGAARIPALTQAHAAASNVQTIITAGTNDGYAKLSGSIDEFRYWKKARTAQEISRFWFTQIAGGTNTDSSKFSGSAQPVDLGAYFKFNEGNTGNDTIDASVLDYSGRVSNGTWAGFVSGSSRVAGPTASAMIESSASLTEFKDPIIYVAHPDVTALSTEMSGSGLEWDLNNNSALYHTMPEWITSEDQTVEDKTLKKLTQIIASYMDTLFLQIKAVPSIGDVQYPYEELTVHDPDEKVISKTSVRPYSNSPIPFAKNQVEGLGLHAPEIFVAANELAQLANRDEYKDFSQKLYDVKNTIYQNIYNNLVYIFKSKGTEKAFRNLIRCFGVDDELIKINLYADNTTYRLDDAKYRSTSIKSKYIDFNQVDRNQSTVYQSASEGTTNSVSYIPGDSPTNLAANGLGSSMTFEADVIFPYKFESAHPSNQWYSFPYLTSSMFGCHEDSATKDAEDFYWTGADSTSDDKASFQVYALRPETDSKDVRFILTSSYGGIPTLTTTEFTDVYDNERWLFSVKVYPESRQLEGPHVSGSGTTIIGKSYTIEFQGTNPSLDQVQNSFSLSGTLSSADGEAFMNANKRVYAGAHRQNFSGSLLKSSDVKVGTVRVWDDYLNDSETRTHAIDPTNFGRDRAYKGAHLFNQSTNPDSDSSFIPQFETLLLNWDFAGVTGSSNGAVEVGPGVHYGGSAWNSSFDVIDASSGSDDKWSVDDKYKYHYTGRGDYFLPNVIKVSDLNFLYAAKTNLPEVMAGADTVNILDKDDDYFTRDSVPVNHYFAIEKSMYQTISEEMLNMFATVTEFNNIIGEPANRYRPEYKALGKLREAFFRKISNTPDFNKFVDYYKWIDDSLTVMLMQLVPATANFSDGVKTMIESHILERNKYWTKFPTLEMKAEDPIGFVKGIGELTYDWKHGHAPIPAWTSAVGGVAFLSANLTHYDTKYIQIISTDGTTRKYVFDDDGDQGVTGSEIGSNVPKQICVQIQGFVGDATARKKAIADELMTAITSAAGHGPKLFEGSSSTVGAGYLLLITQAGLGAQGNTTITTDLDEAHAPSYNFGYDNITFFPGVGDTDSNCLWWKERAEAMEASDIDADRNTLRRILTSDVTTNKILATGEYTDPTDYPNSGFPNAAQFNLSQDGNDLDARTQYKGSTYALRRFSKPYKMHLEKSLNLHGGTNPPSNNKGIDYLWSTHRAFSNAASTDSTGFILEGSAVGGDADYNLKESKCADNITPIEIRKIRRSSETKPYAAADATNALKSMLVSPFQYFSQSSDIATSRARFDVDNNTAYFGLHDDSYGELNETPIQGPFTQAHVGGRQYRHFEASSSFLGTGHNDTNRAEGFRIAAFGEIVYGPKTTDGGVGPHQLLSAPQNAAGMYYRDEVAKRPLNIKNIQSTTASNALGNYERLSQVVITNADESMFYAKLQAAHDDAGLHSLLSGTSSPIVSDTHDFAKLRAVGKTVLDSNTVLAAPYDSTQVDPYLTKHSIIERFSAPGGPDTAGDAFGGFGIDRETNRYAVYNALPWRNLAVRTPLNAMQTAHCAKYGSLAGSALSATDVTTAGTASFHKVHRNSDYDIRNTSTLTAYRANALTFDGNNDYYYNNSTVSISNLQKFTISMWLYCTDVEVTNRIFEFSTVDLTSFQFWLQTTNTGEVQITAKYNAGSDILDWISPPATIPQDKWFNLVVVWDKTPEHVESETPKIYVNGESTSFSLAEADAGSAVGARPDWLTSAIDEIRIGYNSLTWTGNVQDASLWNRALNPTEIKNLYRLPGYDSAGPGDLNRLKFVSSDEDSNALISWWKLGDAVGTLTDSAPIGNNYHLTMVSVSSQATIDTTTFLPANYYATDCIETKDNWFIQHPIPANDFGYAWITASADKDTGCDTLTTASFVTASSFGGRSAGAYGMWFGVDELADTVLVPVDFAGLNTLLYDTLDSSTNTLGPSPDLFVGLDPTTAEARQGYPWITDMIFALAAPPYTFGNMLNSINLHRNGPYGYPSWKQIRTGEHPVAREHKKNNIISVSDTPATRAFVQAVGGKLGTYTVTELKASTHTNYVEPPLSIKHNPLIHSVVSTADGIPQNIRLKHSYANNLTTFSNIGLANKVSVETARRQVYDDLKDAYLASDDSAIASPIKAFKSVTYTETIYPKEINTFLKNARARTAYAETAAVISSSANGDYRTFWRDTLADRRRDDGAANSMGYGIHANPNQATTPGAMYYLGTGSLSIWPLDTGTGRNHLATGSFTTALSGMPGKIARYYTGGGEETGWVDHAYGTIDSIDDYGGTWGELQRNPNASIWASMNTADLSAAVSMKATGSIKFLSDTIADYVGHYITIANYNNVKTRKYVFKNDSGGDDSGEWLDENATPPTVHVQLNGVNATAASIAQEFGTAHSSQYGVEEGQFTHPDDIYISNSPPSFTYTQATGGTLGHTTIESDLNTSILITHAFAGATHFMRDDNYKCPGTASACFNHWELVRKADDPGSVAGIFSSMGQTIQNPQFTYGTQAIIGYGDSFWASYSSQRAQTPRDETNHGASLQMANWSTNHWAGRNPWYDTYEDYSDDIRSMAKEYTVVPEFKISDHMDYYISNNFGVKNFNFLSLEGAAQTSSADTETSGYNETFWKEYCHSDFMKNFATIQKDHEDIAQSNIISFKCSAIKKLLPYNGFYPVQRTLQLASLFSSSYGPYISGSSAASYGEEPGLLVNQGGRDKYFAERMQSLLQPFYAPGIMYNTIKSGIAVDYPIHTASAELVTLGVSGYGGGGENPICLAHSGSMQSIISTPETRLPFEALINPDNYLPKRDDATQNTATSGRMYLTATSFGSSSFYATWSGISKPNYSLAANNFAAEVPNFFLKSRTFTTFRSAPEKKFVSMASGSTYYMDVVLEKSPDMMMQSHGGWVYGQGGHKTGWGYGPRYFVDYNGSSYDLRDPVNPGDPSFAPHCPPYFYGRSFARLAFTPHEHSDMAPGTSLKFTLEDIMSNARLNSETIYDKEIGVGLSAFSSKYIAQPLKDRPQSPAASNQMHISSSVSLFGVTHQPSIQYDVNTRQAISADESAGQPTWVIQSKFECPSLNFATVTGGGLAPHEDPANGGSGVPPLSASWWTATDIAFPNQTPPAALERPIGMWNGYGEIPTGDTGIFLGLRESFPSEIFAEGEPEFRNTGSLLQACGFHAEQRRIGEMANHKWISEAVVAIPFVDAEGRRKFFALGDTQGQSRAVWDNAIVGARERRVAGFGGRARRTGRDGPGRSIMNLTDQMGRYVIPPHLDFSISKDIEPFAMYIFEFHHKLSQQDLSNIWQNVMPDIGVTAEKSSTVLTHETGENEFFRGMPIPNNTRWMVFKVKKRARKDYFKVTADTTDDHQFQFEFDQGGHKAIPDYSYNWPYDFFSLIELAKIDATIAVEPPRPVPPITPVPTEVTGPEADLAVTAETAATATAVDVAAQGESIPEGLGLDGLGGGMGGGNGGTGGGMGGMGAA